MFNVIDFVCDKMVQFFLDHPGLRKLRSGPPAALRKGKKLLWPCRLMEWPGQFFAALRY